MRLLLGNPSPGLLYLFLLGSIVMLYLIPLDSLNVLSFAPRMVLSSLLLNLPIFFAGIVFIHSFRTTQNLTVAYGSNLLGAALGGILESTSFMTGIHSLLILVAILYGLSYVATRQKGFSSA